MPDLLPGETVLLATRRHLIVLLIPLFFTLVSAALLLTQACPVAVDLSLDGRCPWLVGGLLLVAGLFFLLDWWTTRFVLTNRRLLLVQSPVWLRTRSLPITAVEGLSLRAGIFGRLFGFGDVIVDTAATAGGRLVLDFVPGPEAFRDRIAAAVAARGR